MDKKDKWDAITYAVNSKKEKKKREMQSNGVGQRAKNCLSWTRALGLSLDT